jgi:hypothetical protein
MGRPRRVPARRLHRRAGAGAGAVGRGHINGPMRQHLGPLVQVAGSPLPVRREDPALDLTRHRRPRMGRPRRVPARRLHRRAGAGAGAVGRGAWPLPVRREDPALDLTRTCPRTTPAAAGEGQAPRPTGRGYYAQYATISEGLFELDIAAREWVGLVAYRLAPLPVRREDPALDLTRTCPRTTPAAAGEGQAPRHADASGR